MSADKYREGEPESQVRSIIKQLNDERPSKEKSREVVVRPDGTKVLRVIKKRKVTVSTAEKNRHTKKRFLLLLLLLLLMGGAMAVIVSVRMSAMAGESYIEKRQEELRQAWGATSVHCTGAGISGFSLQIESLVAEFPESSLLRRVEMRNISASLATTSFFSGIPECDELKIDSAVVHLQRDAQKLTMPVQEGGDLWKIKRVVCNKFSFYVGEAAESPVSVKQASAYMYTSPASKTSRVLILNNGVFQMSGWKPVVITDAKMTFSNSAVEDLRLTGTLDVDQKGTDSSSISLSGSIRSGADMAGPFAFESVDINFSELSDGRFMQFFNGITTRGRSPHTLSAYITLPLDRKAPLFAGSFRLKDVRITSMPSLMLIAEHLEPVRRKTYLLPVITEATVELAGDEGKTTLRIANDGAVERDVISVRADVTVDPANQLSGTIDYGIPSKLTHMEYPDGLADPIFSDDGVYAWLSTKVAGAANAPSDNAAELDAQAAHTRAQRPSRISFDEIDVDDFSNKMKARMSAETQTATDNAQSQQQPQAQGEEPSRTPLQQNPQPDRTPASGFDLSKLPSDMPLDGNNKNENNGFSLPTDSQFFPGAGR